MERMLFWMLGVAALLPLAGWTYQAVGGWRDRRRYLTRGRMVRVGGGRRVYVAQLEPQGAAASMEAEDLPTVVFESGIAASSQNWLDVQRRVSEYARTVSYDRAGLGWSCSSDSARTPANIARELREMLYAAGIDGPFVIVGHSFGGLVARRFATEYADEVAGVVLLDPMRPEEWPPLNEAQRPFVERGEKLARYGAQFARFGMARMGIRSLLCRKGRVSGALSRATGNGGAHVMGRVTCELGKMPKEVWPVVAAHWSSPKFYRGFAAHIRAVPETVMQVQVAPPLAMPVTLLTPRDAEPLDATRLAQIGSDVRQVIAEKSGHWVHLDEPEVVLAAVREMAEGAHVAQTMA
jgi:pimeloyl-ACP methyl ester carboxylesterase